MQANAAELLERTASALNDIVVGVMLLSVQKGKSRAEHKPCYNRVFPYDTVLYHLGVITSRIIGIISIKCQ